MSLCDKDLSLFAFDHERFYWTQTEQLLRTSREILAPAYVTVVASKKKVEIVIFHYHH